MKVKLLILVPTESEKKYLKDSLNNLKRKLNFTYKVVTTGIGKVNASSVCALETQNEYDYVVSLGYCGATTPFSVGDIVNPDEVFEYRLASLVEKGILDKSEQDYRIKTASITENPTLLYSSDTWVDSSQIGILAHEGRGELFDMESFAIAQVAAEVSVPTIVLKIVADIVDSEDTNVQYADAHKYITNFDALVHALCEIINKFNNLTH